MPALGRGRRAASAAALTLLLFALPLFAPATLAEDAAPIRLGLLMVKTGPLAAGGIQMEQGLRLCLKDHNSEMGGRKVELLLGDTGGNPAGAKTKVQELVERDKVDAILGRSPRSRPMPSTTTSARRRSRGCRRRRARI